MIFQTSRAVLTFCSIAKRHSPAGATEEMSQIFLKMPKIAFEKRQRRFMWRSTSNLITVTRAHLHDYFNKIDKIEAEISPQCGRSAKTSQDFILSLHPAQPLRRLSESPIWSPHVLRSIRRFSSRLLSFFMCNRGNSVICCTSAMLILILMPGTRDVFCFSTDYQRLLKCDHDPSRALGALIICLVEFYPCR